MAEISKGTAPGLFLKGGDYLEFEWFSETPSRTLSTGPSIGIIVTGLVITPVNAMCPDVAVDLLQDLIFPKASNFPCSEAVTVRVADGACKEQITIDPASEIIASTSSPIDFFGNYHFANSRL
ncbi:MAG: hypothetical protein ACRCYZ_02980 [Alphaproteobacteria bacterium]